MKTYQQLILSGALFACSTHSFGAVSQIQLSDFNRASILDFNAAPIGAIASNDGLFTDFGISSVAVAPVYYPTDDYEIRPNASRALWGTRAGMAIVDPGTLDTLSEGLTYSISFTAAQNKFGFGVHDQFGDLFITLFQDSNNVGSITVSSTSEDLMHFYIASDIAFNSLTINNFGGYALDDLTLEASAVPVPGSVWLLGSGLLTLVRLKRT